MDTVAAVLPYSGPRPSPARAWALWVLVTAAACGLGNAALLVLNLVERHYQQQRLAGHAPSVTRIRDTLSMIHTFANLTLIAALAFGVLAIFWERKRRPRKRVARDGESGVEPPLRTVLPPVYWTFWVAIGASFVVNTVARSHIHDGSTIDDIISYRTYLAVGHGIRILMWTCVFVLVLTATALQDRREIASGVQKAEADTTRTDAAFSESLRTATRNCAVAMLAAGDPANEAARRAVIRAVRSQGLERYDDEWIVHDLKTIEAAEITSYLTPIHRSLNQELKETLVAQVASVGLADGTLTAAQTNVLETICASIDLSVDELPRIVNASKLRADSASTDHTSPT